MRMEMLNIILTAWMISTAIYYLCAIVMHIAIKLPVFIAKIIILPAMPFIAAYRNREKHPVQAKVVCWMWGILYALAITICLIDALC